VTVLRLVNETDHPGHSVKAPLSDETLADLEWITRNILAPADLTVAELRHAIAERNLPEAILACRRVLGVGLVAGDWARQTERGQ
jgi:hypothetical protein